MSPELAGGLFTTSAPWEAHCAIPVAKCFENHPGWMNERINELLELISSFILISLLFGGIFTLSFKNLWVNVFFCCCSVTSHVQLLATPWTAANQASLSFIISWSLLRFMFIELVVLSKHLILCHPLLLPSIFPSIRVFSHKSTLHIRPKYWKPQLQHQSFQWIFKVDFL